MTHESACWCCGGDPHGAQTTCGWCGVWVVELNTQEFPDSSPLNGLARRWGIPDDGYRSDALTEASEADLEALRSIDRDLFQRIVGWLVERADSRPVSDLYVALSCLVMAVDEAEVELRNRRRA